jgi:4-amino-4-deoxy-L-arabinose transferase-like glycosyltransferase
MSETDNKLMVLTNDSPYLWNRLDTLAMGGLLLFGFLLRLPHLVAPYVINTDAIKYVQAASLIAQGKFWEGIQITGPSIYPVLISLLYPLVGDFVTAARILTVSFGILTLVPFYLLAREVFDRSTAWISCFFYCLSPAIVTISLEVVRDPVFSFFLAMFLWLMLRAFRLNRLSLFILAGLMMSFAVAIRLNGLLLILIGTSGVIYDGIRQKKCPRLLLHTAAFVLPILIMSSAILFPNLGNSRYLVEKKLKSYCRQAVTILTEAKSFEKKVDRVVSRSSPRKLRLFIEKAWEKRWSVFGTDLLEHWIETANVIFFALMILGFFHKGIWREFNWQFIAFFMAVWLLRGCVRLYGAFAVSRRHLIPLVMVGYLFGALGFVTLLEFCRQRWPRFSKKTCLYALLLLILGASIPLIVKPMRADKLVRREAGEWIRSLGISNVIVVTDRPRVGFYAEADPVKAGNLQKANIYHSIFLIIPASKDWKQFQKKLKPILKASSKRTVFFAYSEDVEEPFLKGKVSTLFSSRWHLVQTKAFRNAKESIMVYQFERH